MSIDELVADILAKTPSKWIKKDQEKIFELIPDLKKCVGFDQKSKWHPYDVFEHTMHVIDNTPMALNVRFAALFHDLGKVYTFVVDENGVGHFPEHYIKSLEIFNEFAKKHDLEKKFSKSFVDSIKVLILYHDKKFDKDEQALSDLINKIGGYNAVALIMLKKADLLAQSEEYHYLLDEYDQQLNSLMGIASKTDNKEISYKRYK